MKTFIDSNFLNGVLTITVNGEQIHGVYESSYVNIGRIFAQAKCHREDKYSEKMGIELVKGKIVRAYHKLFKQAYGEYIREMEHDIANAKANFAFHEKKVKNIEKDLAENYGLVFWDRKSKVAPKKPTSTKKPAKKVPEKEVETKE